MEKKKPVKVFRSGGIRLAIWMNTTTKDGRDVTMPSIQIDRTYKSGDEFKTTHRFGERDLLEIAALAMEGHRHLRLRQAEPETPA